MFWRERAVETILRRVNSEEVPVILIDGPSGSGKSSLATEIVRAWSPREPPVTLVRMDEMYPGWHGLHEASAQLTRELLEPRRRGESGRWRRFDWNRGEQTDWHAVAASEPLLVEGCGTLSRGSARLATVRVWISAPDDVRKVRALERDKGAFDDYWEMWDDQYSEFLRKEDPRSSADIAIDAEYLAELE